MSMRLPMKPSQLPASTAILPSLFASAMTVARVSGEVCRPRTFSSSLMTFAGLKKWVPTTFSGRGARGDGVDIESRSVGGEDRVRRHHPIEPPEYLLLDLEVLVHRLDDDVRAGERRILAHAPNEAERGVGLRASQAPARDRGVVALPDDTEAALEGLRRELEQRHGDAGVGEGHGDAPAHGAGADHGGTVDGERAHLGSEAWNPAGLALREEQVHQRLALRAVAALDERLALARERGFHRLRAGRFDAVDDPERRELPARLRRELAAKGGEELRIHTADALADIARDAQRPPLGHRPAGEGERAVERGVRERRPLRVT